jgi:hypothetical protein
MSNSLNHFKVKELRKRSMVRTTEAIMVIFGALLAIAILPGILLKYLYAGQQLFEQPKLLEYIPIVAFGIATLYFLRALTGNMKRDSEAKKLMIEIEMMGDDCCDANSNDDDEDWDDDLQELEELLAEVEEKAPKKKAVKSKAATKKKAVKSKKSKK